MIVNSINNRINPAIISLNNRVSNAQLPSAKPNHANSDSLQKQMSFMGLANYPITKEIERKSIPILQEYLSNLKHFELPNTTTLYGKNLYGYDSSQIILLNAPTTFSEGINILSKDIKEISEDESLFTIWINNKNFDILEKGVCQNPELKHTLIKGIVGQGGSSTAFLTTDDSIIKLALIPNFPSEKLHIKNVEVPILERYLIDPKTNDNEYIYGVKTPFAKQKDNMSFLEYNKIWDGFQAELKKVNPAYSFSDFFRDHDGSMRQLGFINNTPYILDFNNIWHRPLVEI